MDLRILRSVLVVAAICGSGAAQAAQSTYSPLTFTLPTQPDDVTFDLSGAPFMDNNHVLASRYNGSHEVLEIYSLDNLASPPLAIDTASIAYGISALVGDYIYVPRLVGGGAVDLQRCNYTLSPAQCADFITPSGAWQTVLSGLPAGFTDFAMHNSTIGMAAGLAVVTTSDSGVHHHHLVKPDGSSFEFATHSGGVARAISAGYVDGFLTVLAQTPGGTVAYVFGSSLTAGDVQSFVLDSDPLTSPVDMNASARAVFLTRPDQYTASGDVSFCNLHVSSSDGTPAGTPTAVSCLSPRQSLGTLQPWVTSQLTSRLKDNNELVFFSTTDVFSVDTDNPGAGAVTVASLTPGLTGPLAGAVMTDGRLMVVPLADGSGNSLLYTYTLLTPSGFGGGGGGGGNSVVVNPQPSVVNPGDSRTVLVNLDVTGENIYGVQFSCHADPSILEFVSGAYPPAPDLLTIPLAYDTQTAVVDGAMSLRAPALPFTGTGTFSVLTYLATAPYGTTDITCDVLGSDIDGNAIAFTVQNGTVTINDGVHVSGGATISGIARLPYGTDWSGILVTLTIGGTSVTTTTDATGHYAFSDIMDGSVSISFDASRYVAQCMATTVAGGASTTLPTSSLVAGDINDDDVIDIADFTMMAGHFGSQTGQPRYLAIADLNADGKVNIQDLSILGSHFGMQACTNV